MNQDKERCTALALKHSAIGPEAIIADKVGAGHRSRRLTLIRSDGACANSERMPRHEGHAPRIIPILKCAREAVNPACASLATIFASL